jgi:hypothetical protein
MLAELRLYGSKNYQPLELAEIPRISISVLSNIGNYDGLGLILGQSAEEQSIPVRLPAIPEGFRRPAKTSYDFVF